MTIETPSKNLYASLFLQQVFLMKTLTLSECMSTQAAGVLEYEGFILWDHDCRSYDQDLKVVKALQEQTGKPLVNVWSCGLD